MESDFIPVSEPMLTGNEKKYLIECIESGWISSDGPFVARFEDQLALRLGRAYGIAVCNGSAALELAVAALGLTPGDEVLLPTFTIISCAAAVVRAGCTPVLVDADPVTWNMNVNQLASKITARTRAIMIVHIYGLPVDVQPLLLLAQKHGLKVIEDAAELLGQTYRGQPCGSFGDLSTFSFYPNKHVTTGEGGMVLTNDPELAQRCRSLRNLCFQKKRFVHEDLGWNFRMSNLQAALGVAQLERLDEVIERKRQIGHRYNNLLQGRDELQLPLRSTDYAENVYWAYGLVLTDQAPADAAGMIQRLAELGVGARPFFWPMHEQPVFRRLGLFDRDEYPVAELLARRGFYIPCGVTLSMTQQTTVAQCLERALADC